LQRYASLLPLVRRDCMGLDADLFFDEKSQKTTKPI
jgi:hypothetical protein